MRHIIIKLSQYLTLKRLKDVKFLRLENNICLDINNVIKKIENEQKKNT
jgi:hypothetical protein